ncbi:333f7997-631a-4504-8fdd-147850c0ad40 [Sclerotinia trifoliorum]|uniref:333f7997-631a-4504-8fdd-147850c0ad40 n=1 Tax=Sclerotinia trifoliorum TaxID=28548 RepID=A0A8H2W678_9HELO|nr:333f7997-631a-4504-8fdd-147850c0ad40 [Sclerotinia trifoliorum]
MTRIPEANYIADPDGDLLILLGPTTPPISQTGESTLHERNSTWDYDSRVLVSSKRMSLASPVFKIMLEGSFKESLELKTLGRLTLPLPEDDPVAMRILIDVIHGHSKYIPKVVHIHAFARFAILADYYQCSAVAEACVNLWKQKIVELSLWKRSETRLACWIFITWVFNLSVEFKDATARIVKGLPYGLGEILARNQLELPIPTTVIRKVDEYRQAALKGFKKILVVALSRFRGGRILYDVGRRMIFIPDLTHARVMAYDDAKACDDEEACYDAKACDAEIIEYFTKALSKHSLFPLPQGPEDYKGWVFDELIGRVWSVKVNGGSNVGIRGHQQKVLDITLARIKFSIDHLYSKTFGVDVASLKAHFNVRGAARA